MSYLKTSFLCFAFFYLVGCNTKPEVFFETINIGDNLDACLAKGTIHQNPDYNRETLAKNNENEFEIANNYIASSYFNYSNVIFDGNNNIKEIELKFHQEKTGKTAKDVFTFMTQYFSQRYEGMKTGTVNEFWDPNIYDLKYQKEGIKNIWETNKLKVILQSYDAIRKDKSSVYDENGNWSLSLSIKEDVAGRYYDGKWVQLNITAK